MSNILIDGIERMGINADDNKLRLLETYISELELWNSRLNLVSVENHEQLIIRHILDCLAGIPVIEKLEGETIADIGSGAGLPGLLLAVFLEDRRVTLVERSGKKAGFLRSTAALLKLVGRVEVVDADLKKVGGSFDVVTMRAFREFGDFYSGLQRITAEGGVIAAYKARKNAIAADIKAAGADPSSCEIIPLTVPFLDEERNMLIVKEGKR